MANFIDKSDIRRRAHGRWLEIISTIAPFFAEAAERPGVHNTCPIHGGKDGFRFYKDAPQTGGGVCNTCGKFPDGFSLLSWATGQTFHEVLKDVQDVVGGAEFEAIKAPRAPIPKKDVEVEDRVKRLRLNSAYKTSLTGSAPGSFMLRNYLKSRGLNCVPESLRFHPSMSYVHEDGKSENLPAILAMVHSFDGTPVTMHRTYLDPVSHLKANVSSPKKIMSHVSTLTMKGSAIRLFPIKGNTLALAEGIETSIAVHEATGLPTWASISRVFMESFVPPEQVTKVIIFADKDISCAGIDSANKLSQFLSSKDIECSIQLPPSPIPSQKKGIDWLDEYVLHGKEIFHEIC